MHSFKMVKMRQVSFASRNHKIMPLGENSGSLELTVVTKGRRNRGCTGCICTPRVPSEDLLLDCAHSDFQTFRRPCHQSYFEVFILPLSNSVFDDKK